MACMSHVPETIAVELPDGRLLEVIMSGPPDGAPLVWHHGTPGCARQFRYRRAETHARVGATSPTHPPAPASRPDVPGAPSQTSPKTWPRSSTVWMPTAAWWAATPAAALTPWPPARSCRTEWPRSYACAGSSRQYPRRRALPHLLEGEGHLSVL